MKLKLGKEVRVEGFTGHRVHPRVWNALERVQRSSTAAIFLLGPTCLGRRPRASKPGRHTGKSRTLSRYSTWPRRFSSVSLISCRESDPTSPRKPQGGGRCYILRAFLKGFGESIGRRIRRLKWPTDGSVLNVFSSRISASTSDPQAPTTPRGYYSQEIDSFVFRDRDTGEVAGAVISNASDSSTYYLRYIDLPEIPGSESPQGLRPTHGQGHEGSSSRRIEIDSVHTNFSSTQFYSRLGFIVTGMLNTDRSGGVVRMTKYLKKECREAFETAVTAQV